MTETVSDHIRDLVDYAIRKKLAEETDRVYLTNILLDELHIAAYEPSVPEADRPLPSLETILGALCDDAAAQGVLPDNGIVQRDLFDTRLMGHLTPRPSEVIERFRALYRESQQAATDYFYRLCKDVNYIRSERVARDLKWIYNGKYGDLDITINLSKPEKDPKAIAAARLQKASGYPKCALCRENEGYAGSLTKSARQNIRLIPIVMDGKQWYLQYSPYAYYNEHCIALSASHTPMKIDRSAFVKLLDFITVFPHYFLGSNADLPIVGGSILSHDHMQGGRFTFAVERAPIEIPLTFKDFPSVRAGIVRWPMSVIRLTTPNRNDLLELSNRILCAWRAYTDPAATIFAETDGVPHNTITPIARRRGTDYEFDLVLRNNYTTPEHPLGLYHPHADKHNIKKENIGLIEVMGLAVLPARLKSEMALIEQAFAAGKDIGDDERIAKHKTWFGDIRSRFELTPENISEILRCEIGRTYEAVLEDAGVFPCTEKGREAFLRFTSTV